MNNDKRKKRAKLKAKQANVAKHGVSKNKDHDARRVYNEMGRRAGGSRGQLDLRGMENYNTAKMKTPPKTVDISGPHPMQSEEPEEGYYTLNEKINIYVCEYGCHNITCDVAEGVTPFMIDCEFRGRHDRPLNPAKAKNGRCIGMAKSMMYPRKVGNHVPYPKPTHEWYKPTEKWAKKKGDYYYDHWKNGGLFLRERTDVPILRYQDES